MIIIPTLFGAQVLHNGTTHFAAQSLMPAPQVNLNLVLMANGTWHDPYDATETAPIVPGKITAKIVITMTTQAALVAEMDTLFLLLGTRALLSVASLDGAVDSCQARIEKMKLDHPFRIVSGSRTRVEIVFQCITRLFP